MEFNAFAPIYNQSFNPDRHIKKARKLCLFGHYLQNHVHYSISDGTCDKYMINCSRYLAARIFELVVVAEAYEYPNLLLSMGILGYPQLSDCTLST